MKKKFNWNEIQLAYDSGLSYNEIKEKFNIGSNRTLQKAKDRGDFIARTAKETFLLKRTLNCPNGYKKCSSCKKNKKFVEFNKKGDRLQSFCVPCNKNYIKKYYKENQKKLSKLSSQRKKEKIKKNQQKLFDFLSKSSCVDCGMSDQYVLEFDHVSEEIKKANVSQLLVSGYSWKTIQKEIDKCVIRCSNCHRRKTHKETKTYRDVLIRKTENK